MVHGETAEEYRVVFVAKNRTIGYTDNVEGRNQALEDWDRARNSWNEKVELMLQEDEKLEALRAERKEHIRKFKAARKQHKRILRRQRARRED